MVREANRNDPEGEKGLISLFASVSVKRHHGRSVPWWWFKIRDGGKDAFSSGVARWGSNRYCFSAI